MDNVKNDGVDYTKEDIQYCVDNYLARIKYNDIAKLKSDVASEMGRTKGSIGWKITTALYYLTDGEQGKPNGPKYLKEYLAEYREANNMSLAKMIYWFE